MIKRFAIFLKINFLINLRLNEKLQKTYEFLGLKGLKTQMIYEKNDLYFSKHLITFLINWQNN